MGSSEKGSEKIIAQGTVFKTNQVNEVIIRKVLVRNQYLLKHAIPIVGEPCVKISDPTQEIFLAIDFEPSKVVVKDQNGDEKVFPMVEICRIDDQPGLPRPKNDLQQ